MEAKKQTEMEKKKQKNEIKVSLPLSVTIETIDIEFQKDFEILFYKDFYDLSQSDEAIKMKKKKQKNEIKVSLSLFFHNRDYRRRISKRF